MTWTKLALNGRVLVVDDAMENVQILHQALRAEHEVLFALSGEKALEVARTQLPDLILLDAIMPGMDGYTVCALLRETPELRDIPIIFVTALSRPEDETRALDAGAADFISKPFNVAVVRARVRTQLIVKRQSDALRAMSLTDSLTGVANRRSFSEAIENEWRRCARAGQPMALIMADIDCFKLFNDAYGHQAGDLCLQQVSAAMARCATRTPDLLARYGGEEFVMLLPQADVSGAVVVAQRVLDQVRALAIPHAASTAAAQVTLSMGVASIMPAEGDTPAALIRAADALLYQAKNSGRNRFCLPSVADDAATEAGADATPAPG